MVVLAMVHLGDGVGLHQVLVGITDVVDDSEIRLQNRVPVSERRVEFELVAQRRSSQSNIVTGSNTDLIQHVVVEVVLVWSDAGFFVGIYAQRGDKTLHSVSILDERVNVRGVCYRIASDQRRVHVTGSLCRSD
jgi:hypothetical protein